MKYKTLKIASWNVRTLLDSNPDLPKRRTALVAAELARYKIDIAALSETRLPDSGSLTETGEGYTFFWQGAPLDQPRQMGVGIAVRSSILQTIPTAPIGISPRIMTWRIPLAKAQYATLLSVYGPTLPSEEHIKDTFYNCLHETLQNIPPRDKILLLGDLNARVGSSHHLWEGVLGQHGIGKCNENGLRLLTLCSEHSLTITNTKFQLRNMHKATWMHPRLGHWHLLDYVIVRQRDISEVLITRVMRGAEASTDHRLVRSILRLKIRPITRRRNLSPKINLAALQNSNTREAFQQAVTDSLPPARQPTGDSNITTESLTTSWNNVCATLLQTAKAVLCSTNRRHRDWFDENAENIHDLITAKNKAHDLYLRNPSPTTRNQFSAVRSELQRLLRDMENKWWTNLAAQMQSYMDLGDLHNFYSSLKTAYGPAYSALTPVRSADGTHLLTDSTQILDRWASHFRQLLNHSNPTDPSFLSEVPQLPVSHELDSVPTIEEVIKSIAALKNHKAAGPGNIPAKLLKYGGIEIATQLQQLFQCCWESGCVPQQSKDRRIVTIYKKKGDKSLCNNIRDITILSTAGKTLARIMLMRPLSHS
ncbi:uncharacterized protein LOC143019809 [Oratosquilla oratoria]|uniref:uncharacterized protein LOC143019809 n=1 Tax=Oratosquilla oratoria TaxID=337810 RepID=UPI003F75CFCA